MNKIWTKVFAISVLAFASSVTVGALAHVDRPAFADGNEAQNVSAHPDGNEAWTDKQNKVPRLVAEAAGVLDMKPDELLKQLKKGNSLADAAKSKGIAEEQLVQKLMEIRIARMDEAVRNGKLTAEQAANIKQRMQEHMTSAVRTKGIPQHKHKHGHHHHKEMKEE